MNAFVFVIFLMLRFLADKESNIYTISTEILKNVQFAAKISLLRSQCINRTLIAIVLFLRGHSKTQDIINPRETHHRRTLMDDNHRLVSVDVETESVKKIPREKKGGSIKREREREKECIAVHTRR